MLTARAQGFSVILCILGFLGCVSKCDYNVVVGLGLIFLGAKHPYFHNLFSGYTLIVLTILVDIAALALQDKPLEVFHVIITILEIVAKIAILVSLGLKSKSEKQQLQEKAHRKKLEHEKIGPLHDDDLMRK